MDEPKPTQKELHKQIKELQKQVKQLEKTVNLCIENINRLLPPHKRHYYGLGILDGEG